jgi:hypothetical protein
MASARRITACNKTIGSLVFYRGEQEAVARERLGLLQDISSSDLVLATEERLRAGARLQLRIYSQEAPPGCAEASVRGVVRQASQDSKRTAVSFLDSGALGADKFQSFLRMLSPGLRGACAPLLG